MRKIRMISYRKLLLIFITTLVLNPHVLAQTSQSFFLPSADKKGLIVLFHDIWGIDPFIRTEAERWVELGYQVLVPDLYSEVAPANEREAKVLAEKYTDEIQKIRYQEAFKKIPPGSIPDQEKIGFYGWGSGAQIAFKIFLQNPKIRTGAFVQMTPPHETALKTESPRRMLFIFADQDPQISKRSRREFSEHLKKLNWDFLSLDVPAQNSYFYHFGQSKSYDPKGAQVLRTEVNSFFKKHLTFEDFRKERGQ
ncbi:MAG: dienelactone hydrolase family protein [Pseudobdellovibrionaceae bacterium]